MNAESKGLHINIMGRAFRVACPEGQQQGLLEAVDDYHDIRSRLGYYGSNLFPPYRIYDRQLFVDTLNDWGWFGRPGEEPPWYTGKPWP